MGVGEEERSQESHNCIVQAPVLPGLCHTLGRELCYELGSTGIQVYHSRDSVCNGRRLTRVCSFGNPNAQPPTPTQTPTSGQFPSPVFQTPRNNHSSFEDRSGWTPTFAEEYSVFNSTPGRLINSQHSFAEASTPRPLTASTQVRYHSTAGRHCNRACIPCPPFLAESQSSSTTSRSFEPATIFSQTILCNRKSFQ